MKAKIAFICALFCAASLAGCKTEHTSTTTMNYSVETDEGTTSAEYKVENNNGEITTESTETSTPAEAEDVTEEAAETDAGEEYDIPDAVVQKAEWIDQLLSEQWDSDTTSHNTTYDESWIYVQIAGTGIESAEDADAESFTQEVIPSWLDAVNSWEEDWAEDDSAPIPVCLQYTNDDMTTALFTIEEGQITYSAFDEE
ncbi:MULTISPECIES: hypothetical protein [unclassified Butyrivibrio]|uniref:hypothetical protein n=1 Tax=unclassified Butyrivibrio TaxID=2639466 RepID=UPI000416807B|nr:MULTISPECIES: hypothetical protein [unclassified Butyrivibrio]